MVHYLDLCWGATLTGSDSDRVSQVVGLFEFCTPHINLFSDQLLLILNSPVHDSHWIFPLTCSWLKWARWRVALSTVPVTGVSGFCGRSPFQPELISASFKADNSAEKPGYLGSCRFEGKSLVLFFHLKPAGTLPPTSRFFALSNPTACSFHNYSDWVYRHLRAWNVYPLPLCNELNPAIKTMAIMVINGYSGGPVWL